MREQEPSADDIAIASAYRRALLALRKRSRKSRVRRPSACNRLAVPRRRATYAVQVRRHDAG